jgi:hypothetical protein
MQNSRHREPNTAIALTTTHGYWLSPHATTVAIESNDYAEWRFLFARNP